MSFFAFLERVKKPMVTIRSHERRGVRCVIQYRLKFDAMQRPKGAKIKNTCHRPTWPSLRRKTETRPQALGGPWEQVSVDDSHGLNSRRTKVPSDSSGSALPYPGQEVGRVLLFACRVTAQPPIMMIDDGSAKPEPYPEVSHWCLTTQKKGKGPL